MPGFRAKFYIQKISLEKDMLMFHAELFSGLQKHKMEWTNVRQKV